MASSDFKYIDEFYEDSEAEDDPLKVNDESVQLENQFLNNVIEI